MELVHLAMMAAAPVGAVLMGMFAVRCLRHPHGRGRIRPDAASGPDRAHRV